MESGPESRLEPEVPEGSLLLLGREASAKPSDIVVAWTDSGGVVKRLVKDNGEGYLRGNDGRNIPLTDDVRIAWVVFFIGRCLKR